MDPNSLAKKIKVSTFFLKKEKVWKFTRNIHKTYRMEKSKGLEKDKLENTDQTTAGIALFL